MPPGLGSIPRFFGSLKVQPTDLDPTFAFTQAQINTAIGQASISPDQMGLTVWNATGSTITAGQLVYVSGWNFANSLPQVSLAIGTSDGSHANQPWVTQATHVALASILNGASGKVGKHFSLAPVDTSSASAAGDPVWLDINAGGYVLTTQPLSVFGQVVGRVVIKHSAAGGVGVAGQIDFNLETGTPIAFTDSTRTQIALPTIPVTAGATTSQILQMPAKGTIVSMFLVFVTGLVTDTGSGATHGFLSFTVTNKAAGGGATVLTAAQAIGTNGTQGTAPSTGGTPVVAATPYVLTGSAGPFTVAARDALQIDITANTGGAATLANTLTGGSFLVNWVPT